MTSSAQSHNANSSGSLFSETLSNRDGNSLQRENMRGRGEDQHTRSVALAFGGSIGVIQLTKHRHPDEIEKEWRDFEHRALGTAFQSYHWCKSWCDTAARAAGETPLIIVGRDKSNETVFILPLAERRNGPLGVLTWLAQEHNAYNMGLFSQGFIDNTNQHRLSDLIDLLRVLAPGISAVSLCSQPFEWDGVINPLTHWPSVLAVPQTYIRPLPRKMDDLLNSLSRNSRSGARRKRKKWDKMSGVAIERVTSAEEASQCIDLMLRTKTQQLTRKGIHSVFADADVMNFYLTWARGKSLAQSPDVYRLTIDGTFVAGAFGQTHNGTFHLISLTMADHECQTLSPGLPLMWQLIADKMHDGCHSLDFGPGEGQHKSMWRPQAAGLFETHIALRPQGWPLTISRSMRTRAKRTARNNPHIKALYDHTMGTRRSRLTRLFRGNGHADAAS